VPCRDGCPIGVVKRYAAAEMLPRANFRPFRPLPRAATRNRERHADRSHARRSRQIPPRFLLLVLQALVLTVACTSTQSAGTRSVALLGPGIINDPKNKSLRFDLLKFGLKSFCDEMQNQGVALRVSSDHPVAGRFFARACQADVIDDDANRNLTLKFAGIGYTWTNLTGRVGFDLLGTLELLPDFQLAADNSMYVYFRTNHFDIPQMKVTLVESSVARSAALLSNTDPEKIGREIMQSQLNRGFTVIRLNDSGQMEFGPGLLELGQHPYHPFNVVSNDLVLVNERTEIHRNQQDFIGAFKIDGNSRALALALAVDGAPGVNIAVISAAQAQPLLDRYVHNPGPVSLIEPPRYVRNISYGSLFRQTIPVPEGTYYVLVQHLSTQGAASVSSAGDDRAAKVDYLLQLVDAP
jgi:hypothetical protein